MNKYLMKAVIFVCLVSKVIGAINSSYNKEKNIIEIVGEVIVKDQCIADDLVPGVIIFTPKPPYNNLTFVVAMPKVVAVGQEFIIDYTVRTQDSSSIAFWSDLIPDTTNNLANGLRFIKSSRPSIGTFDEKTASVAKKGGKGIWSFPTGLPANSLQHMTVTVKAISEGTYQFTTQIATNPPVLIGPIGITVDNNIQIISDERA
jgi:hypothetical protein